MNPSAVVGEVEAIDFKKLYLEEKRKAKRRLLVEKQSKQTKPQPHTPSNQPPTPHCTSPITPLVYPEWRYFRSQVATQGLNRQTDRLAEGIYYHSNFILDRDYQQHLWDWLRSLSTNTANESDETAALGKWTTLRHAGRRVALFDSRLSHFPTPLLELVQAVDDLFPEEHAPNHILINEYRAEQGILPHTDGPAYFDRTATLSLGAGAVLLHFDDGPQTRHHHHQVLLEGSGSLIVFEGSAYSHLKHSIQELPAGCTVEHADETCLNAPAHSSVQRDERISITIRCKK